MFPVFFLLTFLMLRDGGTRDETRSRRLRSRDMFLFWRIYCVSFFWGGEIGLGDRHEQFLLFSVIKRKSIIFQHVLFDSTCKIGREGGGARNTSWKSSLFEITWSQFSTAFLCGNYECVVCNFADLLAPGQGKGKRGIMRPE